MHSKTGVAQKRGSNPEVPLATVREVSARDVPRLLGMYKESEPLPQLPGYPPAVESEREKWLTEMLHRGFNFVAEEAGKTVAHLVMIRIGDTGQMSVFVHSAFRRRGIGSALLRVAMDQARDMGLRHAWIATSIEDAALQDVLVHFGFRVCNRTETRTEHILAL